MVCDNFVFSILAPMYCIDYQPSDALLAAFAELPSELKREHGVDGMPNFCSSTELLSNQT